MSEYALFEQDIYAEPLEQVEQKWCIEPVRNEVLQQVIELINNQLIDIKQEVQELRDRIENLEMEELKRYE